MAFTTESPVYSPPSASGSMKAEHDEKKCTNLHAIVNVILAAIGLGVVSLPSIIARCGWVGGILLLLVAALVTDYLICKLHTAVNIHPSGTPIHTYEELGRVCFGRVGQILVVAVVHLTMTGMCSAMLLLLGQNTEKMLPQLSVKVSSSSSPPEASTMGLIVATKYSTM
ncbi:hypothetical protein FOZ62_000065 [Perkinsus olseni]|uniref:Amino acid transporter transmembrane domain-containing protein n=1 Tax=Perkinsus olseni TaxID=32597 RepID=A0A7J6QR72_PEROL|nr:hypothetical protein FOZ62_000065 [Perkinsus olseni]